MSRYFVCDAINTIPYDTRWRHFVFSSWWKWS